jgi:cell division inhibitor SulA/protein ImuA
VDAYCPVSDVLEKLLSNPRIWRGQARTDSPQGLSSGYPKLDQCLPGGGWPQHALTEILLEYHGTGELKLLMPALARLSQPQGHDGGLDESVAAEAGWIAWIAPPFEPYPPALKQWGINLSRVLIVRPRQATEALWAAEQALSSGNCAAVLLWSDAFDDTASRRLQLAAEKGQSWAIAFRSLKALGQASAAALRIQLKAGEQGTDLRIVKSRGGRPAVIRDYAGTAAISVANTSLRSLTGMHRCQ